MTVWELTCVIAGGSFLAGFVGALTGLGGGVVIVPMLVFLGVDIHYAIGASLVSVVATSSGAAAAYLKEGYTNIRIGIFLTVASILGAVFGAVIALSVPTRFIAMLLGVVLLFSAYLSGRPSVEGPDANGLDPLVVKLKLSGRYPSVTGWHSYAARRAPMGFGLMFVAGGLCAAATWIPVSWFR